MKGKEAAAAARRRVQELEAEVLELQRRMAQRAQEAHDREVALKEENARLAGRLDREVKAIADARVAEAVEQGKHALAELEARHYERLGEIAAAITEYETNKLNVDTYSKLHRLLKRKPGEWIVNEVRNRAERRVSAGAWDDVSQIQRYGADRAVSKWQELRDEQTGDKA